VVEALNQQPSAERLVAHCGGTPDSHACLAQNLAVRTGTGAGAAAPYSSAGVSAGVGAGISEVGESAGAGAGTGAGVSAGNGTAGDGSASTSGAGPSDRDWNEGGRWLAIHAGVSSWTSRQSIQKVPSCSAVCSKVTPKPTHNNPPSD
jgi:hypothetical protein